MMGSLPSVPGQADNLADQLRENREHGWAHFLENTDWNIYLDARGQND